MLYAVTRSSSFSWISLSANLEQVGNIIFRMPAKLRHAVAGVAARDRRDRSPCADVVLERRVRGVEVVS